MNKNGVIFVAEYHHVRTGKTTMERPVASFRADLERLYKMGFRPVTVSQYIENKMPLPPGASPVVFTFDDANPSQIRLQDDGTLDPECAMGVWKVFAEKHPDFPPRATFYVLPGMWGQPKWTAKKIEMIRSWGGELANHTITHPNLKRLSDNQVKREFGEADEKLTAYGQKLPVSMALPLGVSPKNRELTHAFDWNGKHHAFTAVMLVGADPAPSPESPKFDRFRVPRIQATTGIDGLDYWLDQAAKGRVKLYVAP